MSEFLKIRFVGEEISPESIKLNELLEALKAYENSLYLIIENKKIDISDVYVSISEIKNESAGYVLTPSLRNKDLLIGAANELSDVIINNKFNRYPLKLIENIKVIQKVARNHNCYVELNGNDNIISSIVTQDMNLTIDKSFYIKGNTVIYGKIERVGGKNPVIRLRLDDDRSISIQVNEKQAKEAAKKIYERIGIKGIATWNKSTKEIESFDVKSFVFFNNRKMSENLNKISEKLYPYWVDIDPDKYIQELRNDE